MLGMFAWFGVALVFRRRFQFSVRSLMVLVVVVALPCSWLAVEMKKAREQMEAVNVFVTSGHYAVFYDDTIDEERTSVLTGVPAGGRSTELLDECFFHTTTSIVYFRRGGHKSKANQGTERAAARTMLLAFKNLPDLLVLDCGMPLDDSDLEHIAVLTKLRRLTFAGQKVTDTGLKHLKGLTQLQRLDLGLSMVTNAGLAEIVGLKQLKELRLFGTPVTDAGLEHLKGLTQLRRLDLNATQVTDAGLANLKGLADLLWLDVTGTKVTTGGIAKLQQALPNCKITR